METDKFDVKTTFVD